MPELTLTIPTDDPDQIEARVRAALTALDNVADDIDVSFEGVTWQHPDWDMNSACPACGSDDFLVYDLEPSTYTLTDSGLEFSSRADYAPMTTQVEIHCDEIGCDTVLYRTPASFFTH